MTYIGLKNTSCSTVIFLESHEGKAISADSQFSWFAKHELPVYLHVYVKFAKASNYCILQCPSLTYLVGFQSLVSGQYFQSQLEKKSKVIYCHLL